VEEVVEEPVQFPIQLNNLKNFTHDQIDRSISKIRKPEAVKTIAQAQ
jgi:hypothetical protein